MSIKDATQAALTLSQLQVQVVTRGHAGVGGSGPGGGELERRNVKDEFTPPLLLQRCGYLAGFVRSRAYDLTLHIIGGSVSTDSLKNQVNFDPYLRFSRDPPGRAGGTRAQQCDG